LKNEGKWLAGEGKELSGEAEGGKKLQETTARPMIRTWHTQEGTLLELTREASIRKKPSARCATEGGKEDQSQETAGLRQKKVWLRSRGTEGSFDDRGRLGEGRKTGKFGFDDMAGCAMETGGGDDDQKTVPAEYGE